MWAELAFPSMCHFVSPPTRCKHCRDVTVRCQPCACLGAPFQVGLCFLPFEQPLYCWLAGVGMLWTAEKGGQERADRKKLQLFLCLTLLSPFLCYTVDAHLLAQAGHTRHRIEENTARQSCFKSFVETVHIAWHLGAAQDWGSFILMRGAKDGECLYVQRMWLPGSDDLNQKKTPPKKPKTVRRNCLLAVASLDF